MLLEATLGVGVLYGLVNLIGNDDDYKKDSTIKTYRELKPLMGKGVTISKNVRLSEKYSNGHILFVAPSDTGKSYRVVMPNVDLLSKEKCTIIVTDPKYEIEKNCNTRNKKVLRFAPLRFNTMGYDPLINCKNTTEVRKLASIIMANGNLAVNQMTGGKSDNTEWIQKATTPLKAYMLWNYKTKKYTFDVLVKRLLVDFGEVIEEIMKSNIEDAKILMAGFLPVTKAPQTFACIRNTLSDCLELFLDDSVINILSKPSINLSQLRKEETVLYIQIPEKDATYYSPLTSVFMSQLMDKLIDDEYGLQTYILSDEFANNGRLNALPETLSSCRSRNISVIPFIQSLNQLELVYGNQSKVLTDLFKTIVFMSGLKDSSEYASNLTGVKTDDSFVSKLLNSDQIRRLNEKECLIISANKNPVVDRLYR